MKHIVFVVILSACLSAASVQELKDKVLKLQTPSINISTQCNAVDLSVYNYTSVARSGYLSVGKGNSVLSFTFYGKQGSSVNDLDRYPTIIWLNGGPGESAQRINFNEVGPLLARKRIFGAGVDLIANKQSWNRNYNLLFVDQPVGSGLAYADPNAKNPIPTNNDDVAKDFYQALDQLYNNQTAGCFSSANLNIKASSPLYIFGQEYGGKFAPAIASLIIRNKENGGFLTGLRGVGIGDGLTSPLSILSEIGNYAYHMSLIDYRERTVVQQLLINATVNLESRLNEEAHNSFKRIMDYVVEKSGNVNIFRHSLFGNYQDFTGMLLLNLTNIDKFNLNRQIQYEMQSDQVYLALYDDYLREQVHQVDYLLNKNVPILVYTGQDNLMVHAPGTMKWVDRVQYADSEGFRNAVLDVWRVNGKIAGTTKSAGNLELKIVFNAGRYVAMDQPEFAFDMVRSFIDRTKQNSQMQVE